MLLVPRLTQERLWIRVSSGRLPAQKVPRSFVFITEHPSSAQRSVLFITAPHRVFLRRTFYHSIRHPNGIDARVADAQKYDRKPRAIYTKTK